MNRAKWNTIAPHFVGGTALPVYGPLAPTEDELRLLPPIAGTRVLELGCGSGHSLLYLAERGAASRIGVILITEAFLKGRYWTEREMGALINSRRRVIPILDGVDHRVLAEYSPLLADLVGLSTETARFDEIAERIAVTLATADEER